MSDVFVSYKRDDEVRVGRLVRALEGAGLSVWWDRGMVAGESWRGQIHEALAAARCVIVVWTHASVGPAGGFVRDEASEARGRGVLVPVLLDAVTPPLGFREIQAVDLTGWKGGAGDPDFQDLVAAVRARVEGRPAPAAQGAMRRLRRRWTYSGLASAAMFGGLAFGFDAFRVQEKVCGMPVGQPGVSDVCGAMGLGERPTASERVAWAGRKAGDCGALREHLKRFPQGAYRGEAAGLLAARRVTETEGWGVVTRRLAIYEPQAEGASGDEAAARAGAMARAQVLAGRKCLEFAATASFRLRLTGVAAQKVDCSPVNGGFTCSVDGEAVCELKERRVQEGEVCGP